MNPIDSYLVYTWVVLYGMEQWCRVLKIDLDPDIAYVIDVGEGMIILSLLLGRLLGD